MYLQKTAIPTLHLPAISTTTHNSIHSPESTSTTHVSMDMTGKEDDVAVLDQPSSSGPTIAKRRRLFQDLEEMISVRQESSKSSQAGDGTVMSPEAAETGSIVCFFDQLFDSVNAPLNIKPLRGKMYRCAVTDKSPHLAFWKDAKRNLSKMYFIKPNSYGKIIPPSLKN
ncbi:hypothetical protein MML48_2g00019376 [Holotrichia oblita]|uniref:Uncharacterized protein n=1 Tax=Holotrichia oblita TaxID=644536 RepID=A0ACB9TN84_HOLOL|nr:hypothetical protein MML48_2g00019376 [Holotrichia oblita]